MSPENAEQKPNEMRTRVISAAVMIAISLISMLLSRLTRVLFLTVVAVLATREMANALRKYSIDVKNVKDTDEPETPIFKTKWWLVASSVIVMGVLIYFRLDLKYLIGWFSLSAFAIFFAEVVSKDWYIPERGRNALGNIFCLVYPAFPCYVIMYYCAGDNWIGPLLLACLSTWTCDSFALFGGSRYGRTKLASLVSPHKTWEGTLTGAAASLVAGLLVWALLTFLPPLRPHALPLGPCVLTALIASTLGQVGDLTASLFKRMAGIKDYSNLIPGHGGAMDRIDSLLFSIPATFFLLSLFGLL